MEGKALVRNVDGESLMPELTTDVFPQPLTVYWRLHHWFGYILGGVSFVIASVALIPTIGNESIGGWWFTIGSAGFLFADIFEWWKNNKTGCLFDTLQERQAYDKVVDKYLDDKTTMRGKYQRAENGINFFCSLTGSSLYFIGSVLFIPSVNEAAGSTYADVWIFIYGSAVIFGSQMWKLYRSGKINDDPYDKTFRTSNWWADWPAFAGSKLFD